MIRSLRLHRSMIRLALLATLLMLLAPLVSRALQDQGAADHAGHAMGREDASGPHPAHPVHHAHAGHAVPAAAPDSGPTMPADPHALHGEACEYCVLSARLLPWLVAALVLVPALRWRAIPAATSSPVPLAARRWPAHAVRGPPKHFEVR